MWYRLDFPANGDRASPIPQTILTSSLGGGGCLCRLAETGERGINEGGDRSTKADRAGERGYYWGQ